MYARLDRYSGQPGHRMDSPDLADLSIGVAGQPGLLSCLTFRQLGRPGGGAPHPVGHRGQRHRMPRT